MNVNNKKKLKDTYIYVLSFVGSIVVFSITTNIWNLDLSVPIVFSGDATGLLMYENAVIRPETWMNMTALSAPFGTNLWRNGLDGPIPLGMIFLISIITKSVGYGVNIYYVLTYGLSGLCACYMLKECGIDNYLSVAGGIIYSMIPGHLLRNINHLFVGSTFSIPLVVLAAIQFSMGCSLKEEYRLGNSIRITKPRDFIVINSKKQWIGLLSYFIVSMSTVYYSFFGLFIITCALLYVVFKEKNKLYYILQYLQYFIVFLFSVMVFFLPGKIVNRISPLDPDFEVITRSRADAEFYGAKIIQLILPVTGHRIPVLAKIRDAYNSSFPLVNENGMGSLGVLMSIGLLLGLAYCIFRFKMLSQLEIVASSLLLFMVLMATVGGGGALVGLLITHSIRAYNRFSFFIGAVGLLISMLFLQRIYELLNAKNDSIFNSNCFIRVAGCFCLVIIAVLDQTTPGMKYTKDYGQYISNSYNEYSEFVNSIENDEGKNADILLLPIMNSQERATSLRENGVFTDYEYNIPFVVSNTSNWSSNAFTGEKGDKWQNWLKGFGTKTQIEIAGICGFEGIALYKSGFSDEELAGVKNTIESILGQPTEIGVNGNWEYYSLDEYNKVLENKYSEELTTLKDEYLNDFANYGYYDCGVLYSTVEQGDLDEIVLNRGSIQYGPYIELTPGEYTVDIYGTNLDNADFDCIYEGEKEIKIDYTKNDEDHVSYTFHNNEYLNGVEFRTLNNSNENVEIKGIKTECKNSFDTNGIYAQEEWGRWAESECSVTFDNKTADTMKLSFKVQLPGDGKKELKIKCGDYERVIDVEGESYEVLDMPIKKGENVISLKSYADDIVVSDDSRKLNLKLIEMTICTDDTIIRVCSNR